MCPIPRLVTLADISKREAIQTILSIYTGPSSVNGEEDEPRKNPNGKEELSHEPEESNKDVGIYTVLCENGSWIR